MRMLAGIAIGSVVLSYFGVRLVRHWAVGRGLLDVPNHRSSHSTPTPRGGGVVFLPIVGLAVLSLSVASDAHDVSRLAAALVFSGLVAGISLIDDVRTLSSGARFLVHLISAAGVILTLGAWQEIALPGLGVVDLGWSGNVITLIWIVGLINAYNFMDGIDGIAGSQAVVAGITWAVIAWIAGAPSVAALALVLAAAALGFLGHNWPPARIFMGDVGSAFLGFMFAIIPLLISPRDPYLPLAAGLVLWAFVADTSWAFVRRLMEGKPVFSAHREHCYQRLVQAGWSHRAVTLLYAALGSAGAVMAMAWWTTEGVFGWAFAVAVAALWAGVIVLTRRSNRPTRRNVYQLDAMSDEQSDLAARA